MSLNLFARKRGMTRFFDESGKVVPCTVIEFEPNVVSQVKTKESDSYDAVQLSAFKLSSSQKKKLSKPLSGHFSSKKIEPHLKSGESRTIEGEEYTVGQEIGLEYFEEKAFIDVTSKSKGAGFQGVMKRFNAKGGPAAHGSGFHRHAGSTGMRSTPGRCLPGTMQPGHMGHETCTVEGLEILKIDNDLKVLLVKGSVPGPNGAILKIRKALKKVSKKTG